MTGGHPSIFERQHKMRADGNSDRRIVISYPWESKANPHTRNCFMRQTVATHSTPVFPPG